MPLSLCVELEIEEQRRLLAIARQSIEQGLEGGQALDIEQSELDGNLLQDAAVFVTLSRNGALRGCIGGLEAVEPLAQAVARMAFSAAFSDRRFARLDPAEMNDLQIEISVLSTMAAIEADSRENLLLQLQPGTDGLLLKDKTFRSTFLPQVWEKLSTADDFLDALMQKAGLPAHYWSESIRFYRYHCFSFTEPLA